MGVLSSMLDMKEISCIKSHNYCDFIYVAQSHNSITVILEMVLREERWRPISFVLL